MNQSPNNSENNKAVNKAAMALKLVERKILKNE